MYSTPCNVDSRLAFEASVSDATILYNLTLKNVSGYTESEVRTAQILLSPALTLEKACLEYQIYHLQDWYCHKAASNSRRLQHQKVRYINDTNPG